MTSMLCRVSLLILIAATVSLNDYAQTPVKSSVAVVLEREDDVPEGAKLIGKIKAGNDDTIADCSYEDVMEEVKKKALEAGGNVVRITEVKSPDVWSSCYRVKGNAYYYENVVKLAKDVSRIEDSIRASLMSDTSNSAFIFVYRPRTGPGMLVQYDLHIDDTSICTMKLNSAYLIKLTKKGMTKFWARTEARQGIGIDVRPRQLYFLRCTVKMGVMVGEPEFERVGIRKGFKEYSEIVQRNDRKHNKKS